MDLEEEEYQGIEEVDAKVVETISMLPKYIPPWKGKTKVTKDPDSRKFRVSTPLLPEKVTFEGSKIVPILLLKLDD